MKMNKNQIVLQGETVKAYFEYEDATFWAIRVEGQNCFSAQGGRDDILKPEYMLNAGTGEVAAYFLPPNPKHLSFDSPAEAEEQTAKMIKEKSGKNETGSPALKQDAEFWQIRPLAQEIARIPLHRGTLPPRSCE